MTASMAASTSSASPASTRITPPPASPGRARQGQPLTGEKRPFRFYGPTCDSADVLPRPVMLPDTVAAGDFVLFDAMGAYTVSSRSPFNGYYPDSWAVIA